MMARQFILCLSVLIALLLYLFFYLTPVAWGESSCKPSLPTEENVYHPSEPLWQAVQDITGYRGEPPVVVRQDFTRENVPDERLDPSYAGGCYLDGVAQVKNEENETVLAYYLMHEYAHHALTKLEVPIEAHHCLMAERNYSGMLLMWLFKNGHAMAREIYSPARRNEVGLCGGDE